MNMAKASNARIKPRRRRDGVSTPATSGGIFCAYPFWGEFFRVLVCDAGRRTGGTAFSSDAGPRKTRVLLLAEYRWRSTASVRRFPSRNSDRWYSVIGSRRVGAARDSRGTTSRRRCRGRPIHFGRSEDVRRKGG